VEVEVVVEEEGVVEVEEVEVEAEVEAEEAEEAEGVEAEAEAEMEMEEESIHIFREIHRKGIPHLDLDRDQTSIGRLNPHMPLRIDIVNHKDQREGIPHFHPDRCRLNIGGWLGTANRLGPKRLNLGILVRIYNHRCK